MSRFVSALLLLALALVMSLLFFGISDPFDGFHGFQEAWYAVLAENYTSHSLFMPTGYDEFLDLYVPPFFSYLVYASFSLFGPTEAAARIVPIAFAFLSLVGVYLLAEELVHKGAGLEAAALFGSTPIFVILGRNVQADVVYVALMLFFIWFYLKACRSGSSFLFAIAGLFLGLSLFTKQFAVIPAAAVVVWEIVGPDRKKLIRKNWFLLALVATLALLPYYGYHLLFHLDRLIANQMQGSASKAGLATGPAFAFLAQELFWAVSPLTFIGAVIGLTIASFHLKRNPLLVMLAVGFFFLFYLFFHRHSYYVFGMIPFLALAFSFLRDRLGQKMYQGILLLSIGAALVFSTYQALGSSYGGGELKMVGEYLGRYRNPIVFADESFVLNYTWLFRYYAKNATLLNQRSQLTPGQRQQVSRSDGIFTFSDIPLETPECPSIPIKGRKMGIKWRSRCYIHNPPNIHFFTPALPSQPSQYVIIRSFGPFVLLEQTSFYLIHRVD